MTQTLVTGKRDATTVPTQALFLLNSPSVRKQSLALAQRLLATEHAREAERVQEAYRRVLGRHATAAELDRGATFIASYAARYQTLPAFAPPDLATVAARAVTAPNTATALVGQEEERIPEVVVEEPIKPQTPREAAWMSFVQALFASGEFRFVH